MKTITSLFFSALSLFLVAQNETTISVIGCHNQHNPAPAIPYMANTVKPDYTVWVGDNVYADTETDPQHIKKQLDILGNKAGFQELKQTSKFFVTWDDHDYGLNNAGKEYVFKEESKQIHRQFWELEKEIPQNQDGIYYSKIEKQANGKTVQFIMLDIRYNRDKPGRNAKCLGEKQWIWLQKQLMKPADIRFIVSGFQVLINRPTRWEAWRKLGNERQRLYNLIQNTNAKGVVFLTGDQHYVEVLKKNNVLGYNAYEIMAAGINKNERPGWASCRIAGPDVTIHNAPLITIKWDERLIHFTNTNVENREITLDCIIPFNDIGL